MLSYTIDEEEGLIDILVDGEITRRDYEELIPVLLSAIKELSSRVETLEREALL